MIFALSIKYIIVSACILLLIIRLSLHSLALGTRGQSICCIPYIVIVRQAVVGRAGHEISRAYVRACMCGRGEDQWKDRTRLRPLLFRRHPSSQSDNLHPHHKHTHTHTHTHTQTPHFAFAVATVFGLEPAARLMRWGKEKG
jgi:hypothetical protein